MNKEDQIVLINSEDYEGLYLNGKLIREAHCLEADMVLTALGIDHKQHWVDVKDGHRLPHELKDLTLPKTEAEANNG